MSEWTPGPWKTGREDMQSYDGVTGLPFTNIYHSTLTDGEHLGQALPLTIARAEGPNNKANAKLIAAAPALAEALRGMLSEVEGDGRDPCVECEGTAGGHRGSCSIRIARAALAAAGVEG